MQEKEGPKTKAELYDEAKRRHIPDAPRWTRWSSPAPSIGEVRNNKCCARLLARMPN